MAGPRVIVECQGVCSPHLEDGSGVCSNRRACIQRVGGGLAGRKSLRRVVCSRHDDELHSGISIATAGLARCIPCVPAGGWKGEHASPFPSLSPRARDCRCSRSRAVAAAVSAATLLSDRLDVHTSLCPEEVEAVLKLMRHVLSENRVGPWSVDMKLKVGHPRAGVKVKPVAGSDGRSSLDVNAGSHVHLRAPVPDARCCRLCSMQPGAAGSTGLNDDELHVRLSIRTLSIARCRPNQVGCRREVVNTRPFPRV
mmetsp:Transcript_49252/g.131805  ORF Transcript_49252/g.131805 Transcript_49252/m.131805 type:complete len:254 (+) Transcript_49252:692-1453(+)